MKILFIGLGSIGRRHLRLLKKLKPKADFLAYRHSRSVKEYNCKVKEFYDLETALGRNPDIAFITNPTSEHVDYAIKCAQQNCHLFIEKPLSNSLENTEELMEISEEKNLTTMVGYHLRFHPVLEKVNDLLPGIGDIYYTRIECGSYLPEWRPDKDYEQSYSAKKELGGGVVLDLSHEIDYLRWLLGEPKEIKSVNKNASHLKINTEDLSESIIEFRNSSICSLHLDYFRSHPKRRIEVTGEKGTIEADLIERKIKVKRKNGENQKFEFDVEQDEIYKKELSHFLEKVDKEQETQVNLNEGLKTLKLALRIKDQK